MEAHLSDPQLHKHLRAEGRDCGVSEKDIKKLIKVIKEFTYYNDHGVDNYDIELNNDGNLEIWLEEEKLSYKVTLYK